MLFNLIERQGQTGVSLGIPKCCSTIFVQDNFWPGCKKTSSNSFKSSNNFCFSWGVKVEAEERLCSSIGKDPCEDLWLVELNKRTALIKSVEGVLLQGLCGIFSLSLADIGKIINPSCKFAGRIICLSYLQWGF